jgi:hypothetical protein
METNVGGYDRTARLIIGPILLLLGIAALVEIIRLGTTLGIIVLVLGAVFTVTGVSRKCILNQLLGVNTVE